MIHPEMDTSDLRTYYARAEVDGRRPEGSVTEWHDAVYAVVNDLTQRIREDAARDGYFLPSHRHITRRLLPIPNDPTTGRTRVRVIVSCIGYPLRWKEAPDA